MRGIAAAAAARCTGCMLSARACCGGAAVVGCQLLRQHAQLLVQCAQVGGQAAGVQRVGGESDGGRAYLRVQGRERVG